MVDLCCSIRFHRNDVVTYTQESKATEEKPIFKALKEFPDLKLGEVRFFQIKNFIKFLNSRSWDRALLALSTRQHFVALKWPSSDII